MTIQEIPSLIISIAAAFEIMKKFFKWISAKIKEKWS